VNALPSGAVIADNESTLLPDKLVSLALRITAADIGTEWSSWYQAESTSSPESRSRSMAAWMWVGGSSFRRRRLPQLFLIQSHFNMRSILLYVISSSSCQVVHLLDISAPTIIYQVYTTC